MKKKQVVLPNYCNPILGGGSGEEDIHYRNCHGQWFHGRKAVDKARKEEAESEVYYVPPAKRLLPSVDPVTTSDTE
jgi:hypothetical protein